VQHIISPNLPRLYRRYEDGCDNDLLFRIVFAFPFKAYKPLDEIKDLTPTLSVVRGESTAYGFAGLVE
jgi:hypothetical protein